MAEYKKNLPQPDFASQDFWDGTKRHELLIQRCKSCNQNILYPREVCPNCLSTDLEWVKASGKGRVYSYTVVRQAIRPAYAEDIPIVVALVQLDEGPRLLTNLVDCKAEDVKVDMPVMVAFEDATEEITLAKFKPA